MMIRPWSSGVVDAGGGANRIKTREEEGGWRVHLLFPTGDGILSQFLTQPLTLWPGITLTSRHNPDPITLTLILIYT